MENQTKTQPKKNRVKTTSGTQGPISGAIANSPSHPGQPDQDTYGGTATHTLATGGGTSGGFGSTGGSPEAGSSDYPKEEGHFGNTTPGKKAESARTQTPGAAASTGTHPRTSQSHVGASRSDMSGFHEDANEGAILKRISDLGDLLERAGERIERAGFSKIGEAIYRLGDRLEHLKRRNNPSAVKADDSVEVDQNVSSARDVSRKSPSHPDSETKKKPTGTSESKAF